MPPSIAIILTVLAVFAVGWLMLQLNEIETKLDMTKSELSAALDKLTLQVGKVALEQSTRFDALTLKVKELTDIIEAGEVSPEVQTALAGVQAALQSLDDAVPDAPEPPPVP